MNSGVYTRLITLLTYAGAFAALVLIFILAIRTEGGNVSVVYLIALLVVAGIGLLALVGSLSDMVSRATLGASLFGGALVASSIFLIQANSDHHRDVLAATQQRADDKRNFILSLVLRRNLSGLNFAGRDLSNEDLGDLIFHHSQFLGANLANTTFTCADLTGAVFSSTMPTGEDQPVIAPDTNALASTDFTDAILSGADLSGLDLTNTRIEYTVMERANFTGARFGDMNNIDADGSDLSGAFLQNAQLSNVSLRGANLSGAHLSHAGLGGEDPPSAVYNEDLYGPVDLRGADLRSADLSHADMTGAILTGAIADSRTRWPPGFDARRHGVHFSGKPFVPKPRIIPLPESPCPL